MSESISRTTSGTNNNVSTFGVLWDDTYLYVAAKVLDAELQNDSELPWFDDSVEVYLDGEAERSTNYDGNDFHFIKGWNDPALAAFPARGATGVLHATADISGGYTVELAIPWSTLGVAPAADKLLGFDVQQNDDERGGDGGDRDGAATWSATVDTNHLSTAEFGRLTLSSELVGGMNTGGGGGTGGGIGGGTGGGIGSATGGGAGGAWQALPLRTQAQKAAGLPGGEGFQMIFGMTYAPSNGDVAYMVTDTSRVWKSVDRGQTWALKSRGIPSNGGISVVVSPSDENRVLMAASLHGNWGDSPADGIYLTTNGGNSWRQVYTTHFIRQRTGTHFAFSKTPGLVYAATHDLGVLRSTDHGETWSALNVLSAQMLSDIEPHPSNPAVVYVAAPTGLFRVTAQAPATAQRVGAGLSGNPVDIVVAPSTPTSPPTLYVSAANRGVFKSTDGGDSFVAKNSGLDAVLVANPNARVRYLGQSLQNPRRLYASISGLALLRQPFWSDDGGEHWHEADHMDSGDLFADLSTWTTNRGFNEGSPIAPHPFAEGTALAMGAPDHPVMTTDGGKTWRYSGNGYTGGGPSFGNHGIGWNDARRFALFLNDYGVFRTENAGDTFRAIKLPTYKGREDSGLGAADPTPGSRVMLAIVGEALTGGQPVPVITLDGTNWTLLERDAAGNSMEDDYGFSTVAFNPQNPNTIYAKHFRSMDKGRTWTRLPRDIKALFPGNGSIVYSRDSDALGCTVYKSTDSGSTWSQPMDHFSPCSFGTMAVDPNDQNRLYVASRHQGVYVYDGLRWALKAEAEGLSRNHFGQFSLMLVAADPRPSSSTVYAAGFAGSHGHSNGIFRSTDRGASWQSISDNLGPDFNVSSIQVNPWDGRVFIGSAAGTWWRAPPP